ncbi:MAG: response regulator transcription factor [Deltaproteobacteria bacterium]|nr:response regulator transcription factor [Deltaproteobacteria bacterium]MBN2674011.1 response regulator transcription factor [Deltaproteobacteria bacterium]
MNDEQKHPVSWFPDDTLEAELERIPLHLLVAEDDLATRNILTKTLTKFGYRVSSAADGAEAMKLLQNEDDPPELAILDWMMPEMDGIEICRALKKRKRPFVFTILLTARCQDEDIIEGLDAGAHEFLTKPFNIHVLAARVAAGARIVRLEKKLMIKSEILRDYLQKLDSI